MKLLHMSAALVATLPAGRPEQIVRFRSEKRVHTVDIEVAVQAAEAERKWCAAYSRGRKCFPDVLFERLAGDALDNVAARAVP